MSSTAILLEKLKQGFVSELPEKIDGIEEHILACVEGRDFDEAFQEAYRGTHSLKGAGGTFGISIITSICHQLEDTLTLWQSESFSLSSERQTRCLDYIDLLRQTGDILSSGSDNFSSIIESLHQYQAKDFKDKLRVLLVESSKTTREICKQTIDGFNVEVVEMNDGYEALGRLLHERFDVLIAGKEIGLLNGQMLISLVAQMRSEARHHITTIMITSSKQDASITKRASDPAVIVNKGVEMVGELQRQFESLSAYS